MSTKTTFKRIALVAVAALGLGVLSVAPSSATATGVAITVGDAGSSTLSSEAYTSDSTTAATFTVAGLLDNAIGDTVTVSFVTKTSVVGTTATPRLYFYDTTTPTTTTRVDSATALAAAYVAQGNSSANQAQTVLAADTDSYKGIVAGGQFRITNSAAGYVGAKFGIQLDSATARVAGTTVYTVIVKSYSAGVTTPVTTTADVSITIAKSATVATTVNVAKSYATLVSGTADTDPGSTAVDAAITSVATASATSVGYVYVAVRNADGTSTTAAQDSVTATITGAGILKNGSVTGSSLKIAATGDQVFEILPDGRAGVATIQITTNGATYSPKTVTFYAKSAKTITASVNYPTLAVGTNSKAVNVTAVDANGTAWTGQAYIVASSATDALVGGSATAPVKCNAWNATDGITCPIATIAAGTAKFKVIDASTVAAATATSNEVTVTASQAAANTVKIAFDKATYAPFEKAKITVTPLDVNGKQVAANTWSNLFATGGITSTIGFSANSDTLTAVAITTDPTTGAATYTVYMPAGSGAVTVSATGGTSLPAAGQVKVSATATVVNSSVDAATDAANEATDAANAATDAALAAADAADAATAAAQDASDAVAALSAKVEAMVASLKAQITSLTNLVIKIQKKVKA